MKILTTRAAKQHVCVSIETYDLQPTLGVCKAKVQQPTYCFPAAVKNSRLTVVERHYKPVYGNRPHRGTRLCPGKYRKQLPFFFIIFSSKLVPPLALAAFCIFLFGGAVINCYHFFLVCSSLNFVFYQIKN